uniref:CCDC92 domain-containing protein n=1 Tax=Macrostomum lignano TaxID=282301 RepID=A0A1I8FBQ7_9PLAT
VVERQAEVKSLSEQLEQMRRQNLEMKNELCRAIQKRRLKENFAKSRFPSAQTSRLMQVIEEEREILDATRRENYQLRAKVELDGQDIQGLEGRLGELEAQLGELKAENAELARRLTEAADTIRSSVSGEERQPARRAGGRGRQPAAAPDGGGDEPPARGGRRAAAAPEEIRGGDRGGGGSGGHRGGRAAELPDDWLEADRQPGQRLTAAKSGDEFVLVCTPRQQAAASRSGGGGLSMRRYPEDQRISQRVSDFLARVPTVGQARRPKSGAAESAAAPVADEAPERLPPQSQQAPPQQPSEPQQQQQQQVANRPKLIDRLRTQVACSDATAAVEASVGGGGSGGAPASDNRAEQQRAVILQGLEALDSFRSASTARTALRRPSARPSSRQSGVPRLNLDFATRDGAEQQQSGADSVRDFLESRELTASARALRRSADRQKRTEFST